MVLSLVQAISAAEAGVTLISPYIGRVSDWYIANNVDFNENPGVKNVREMHNKF